MIGTNSIYRKQFTGAWSDAELIADNLNAISNIGITYLGDDSVIAYTEDGDDDAETTNDVELFEYYHDELNRITEDDVTEYGLSMQDKTYAWIHDNQLWERSESGLELLQLPINPLYLSNLKILSNGKDKIVVWEQSEDFASDLYASLL